MAENDEEHEDPSINRVNYARGFTSHHASILQRLPGRRGGAEQNAGYYSYRTG